MVIEAKKREYGGKRAFQVMMAEYFSELKKCSLKYVFKFCRSPVNQNQIHFLKTCIWIHYSYAAKNL